jgi:nucleoside-diphosphate kinase
MKLERTLVLIKPDAVDRGVVGEIIHRFERVGLKLVGMKLLVSEKDTAERHYREDIAERYGQHVRQMLLDMIMSGPVIAMVWEGIEAVPLVRKLVGATYPAEAAPGTIRGDFAHISKEYARTEDIPVENLVHASGSPDEAEIEIGVWFKPEELVAYKPGFTRRTLPE